ncbi:MAG: electron transport complex subunit RsxC [Lachnospiraceae bacterium]|nr:electron transport complex subunit RsxC [Lachnospiraceae bacterium]
MAHSTFQGGVHPFKGKRMSKDKFILDYQARGEMVYPLSQHIGAPARPVVKKGDRVLTGQKIAEASGYVSAPIHASVSGTVKAIEPRLTISGQPGTCIVVDNDELYEEVEYPPVKPLEELKKEEILEMIRDAGIVGMGGAGFPTHVKLAVKSPSRIKYVIVNCSECEPYLTSDYRRMVENPDWLVMGLKAVLRLFDRAVGILAIEDHKRDAITALQIASGNEKRMEVHVLQTKYPQGSERMLVYACTGREINSSMLPADAGCIVNNVDTICAVYQAVYLGRPLTRRIVTVTGDAVSDPCNFNVAIGTSYKELIQAAGGFRRKPKKMISGGPMMGVSLTTLAVPVVKTSSALLCMIKDEVARSQISPCIHCGYCVTACPERLIPSKLADYAERFQEEPFRKLYGMECMECGSCSYVCPAKRQLTQAIRAFRRELLAKGKK